MTSPETDSRGPRCAVAHSRPRRLDGPLIAAVFALMGLSATGLAQEPKAAKGPGAPRDISVYSESELSFYADSDHVTVVTPAAGATISNPISGWSAGGRYLVDAVSAASVDIVATATPAWQEGRHVVSADAAYKPGDLGGAATVTSSIEPDYVSVSGGGGLTWEILRKHATLQLGYGYSHDTSGRAGTPFEVFSRSIDRHSMSGSVSWVVNRSTIATVVGDAVLEEGDTSKPYRYVPMFEPGAASGIPAGAAIRFVNEYRSFERPLEQLPLSRQRFAITGRLAHRFADATLRLDERFYADAWGVKASTTDLRFILDVNRRLAAAVHARAHLQTGAGFWRRAYELIPRDGGGLVPPAIRTGDRELGPLYTVTGGFSAEVDLSRAAASRAWVLRLQADGIFTHFLDTLYISRRYAVFAALHLAANLD
jgi:hypothetical protein